VDVTRYARNNLVLQYIPFEDFSTLTPHMHIQEVDAKEVLHQAGEPVRFIYFPITALMSMLMPTSDGSTVELAMVGREGFTGMSALLHNVTTHEHGALTKVMTVIPGSVVRMKSDAFITAADSSLSVARSLRRYLSLLFIELALSVTCNRLHSLEQRCARWLLTAMDKSGTTEIPVTQEMLAGILGVYRQSIVQVLNDFETAGLIQRGRGAIRVETRERLVAIVCECYFTGRKRTLGR
jgi:CRP-like cAMP-binding protein